ncbi:MAG TPA: hypothetical protein VKA31_05240 [Mariprofundaceae bacterium]|nr:hypothetical protein [Mariprofundaceae bacterium]
MGFIVHLGELGDVEMRIALGGAERGMTEQLLNGAQISTLAISLAD